MPTGYVAKIAKKHNVSVSSAETKWNKAKRLAANQGHEQDYDYVTGIFKKLMGESLTDLTFKQFLILTESLKQSK